MARGDTESKVLGTHMDMKSDKSINPGMEKTNNMGMTNEEFWKSSSKDVSKLGFEGKKNQVKNIQVAPSATQSLYDSFSRVGTAQDKYKYNKEKERDPAVMMAALNYKKMHQLRNEAKDSRFSYMCSGVDTVLDNSNSHPSFRIYYSFIHRFMYVIFIVCLLGNCLLAYNGTSDWYSGKDIKFGFERVSLGNIDGLEYQSEGANSSKIGKDNGEIGLKVTLAVDLTISIFIMMFALYQIYVSKMEMRAKNSPISIRDYAVKVSNIQKGCPAPIEREIQKQFIKFGKIVEIVPIKNYNKALAYELEIRKIGERIGDQKARDQIKNQNNQKSIDDMIAQEQKITQKQNKVYYQMKKDNIANEFVVVFETVMARNDCINEHSKYSHWWSRPHSKMPNDIRFHGKYGYKVKEAPEPSEYMLEHWYYPRWLNVLLFLIVAAIAILICSLTLVYTVRPMEDDFDKIPLYTQCTKYDFSKVTASTYLTASKVNKIEVDCYCRFLGEDKIDSSGDNRKLCNDYLDYFPKFYTSFFGAVLMMLTLNLFLTYYFKLAFSTRLFKMRYKTTRFILTI